MSPRASVREKETGPPERSGFLGERHASQIAWADFISPTYGWMQFVRVSVVLQEGSGTRTGVSAGYGTTRIRVVISAAIWRPAAMPLVKPTSGMLRPS